MAAKPPYSKLQLVERVDSWPYFAEDPIAYRQHMLNYHYLLIKGYDKPFGYVHKRFVEQIDWPDTLVGFPLYSSAGEHVLDMNGSGVDVLGIVNFSVHMIGWVATAEGIKLWVPRRSRRMSFPGMLDSTVGGSLPSGERSIDGIVRECEEEICLDPAYTRASIISCGTNSFQLSVTDSQLPACQHQVQYLYEMEFRRGIIPKIGDGEVGELNLMTIDEVREAMRNGEFKLSCNMTYLAFLIRHGYINAENEPDLPEICARLNRRHQLFIAEETVP